MIKKRLGGERILTRYSHAGLAVFLALSFHAVSLQAQTWTGATSGNFGTNTNWSSNVTFGTTADLTFSAANANASSSAAPAFLGADRTIRSLNFDADADKNVFIRLAPSSASTTNSNLIFQAASGSANLTVASGATGNYTIGASTPGYVTLGSNLNVDHNGSGNLLISKNIHGTGFGITKNGAGTLILSGVNSFTGNLAINAGTLSIDSINNAGAGTLGNSTNTITLGSFGNTGTLHYSSAASGSSTRSFSLATGGTGSFNTVGNLTISGVISGDGEMLKDGAGRLIISGNNTFNSKLTIANGEINITSTGAIGGGNFTADIVNNGSLNFLASPTQRVHGIISGSGSLSLNGSAQVDVNLYGANTFSGGVSIGGGATLNLGNSYALGSGTLTLASGVIDNITAGNLVNSNNNNMIWGGNFTFYGTDNLDLGSGNASMTKSLTITARTKTLTIGGNISDGGNNYGITLSSVASGVLVLSGNNSFGGGISISSGTLSVNNDGALGTGKLTINGFNVAIDNRSGVTVVNARNNAIDLLGNSFNFIGTNGSLNLGTGAVRMLSNSQTVTVASNSLTFGGAISGVGYSLTKNGSGALILGGANTFTGGVILNAGTLGINNAAALGNGSFTIAGGTIDNTSGAAITNSRNNTISWNANFTFAGSNDLNLGTGAVTISAPRTVTTSSSNLTMGGVISGMGFSLTKNGSGALILGGANTFSGGVILNAGTLGIHNAAALGNGIFTIAGGTIDNTSGATITNSRNNAMNWNADFAFTGTNNLNLGTGAVSLNASRTVSINGGNLTVGGIISGTGFGLTKAGAGTLTLTGNNTYSGTTTINAGTLSVSGGVAILDTGTVSLANTAEVVLSIAASERIGSLIGGGSTGGTVSVASGQTLTIGETGTNTYEGIFAGSGSVSKVSAGNLTLTNSSSSLSGGVKIDNGSILVAGIGNTGANSSLGTNGTIQLGAETSVGTLVWNGAADETTDKVIDLKSTTTTSSGGTITSNVTGYTLTFTSNMISTGSGDKTFTLNGVGNTVFAGNIVNGANTTMSFTKSGAGNATLSGTNTYTGTTLITAGTLQIGGGSTTGSLSTSSAITNNATLAFNRSDTITQGTDFASVIAGTGALIQAGSGNLVLSGVNTYSGLTTVSSGMLQISNASALGGTGNGTTVASGATLALSGNITLQGENITISGSGVGGNGALRNLAGSNTMNTTAVTITLAADASIGSDEGTLTLERSSGSFITSSNNSSLTLVGAGNFTIRNNIALGAGGLTMNGTGTFTMGSAASSSYTGLTTINSGTLVLANSDRISNSSSLVVNGGRFNLASFNETVAGVQMTAGNITSTTGILTSTSTYDLQNGTVTAIMAGSVGANKTTAGTVTLSGNNTFSGSLSVEQGTVSIATINNASTNGALGNSTNAVTLGSAGNTGTLSYTGSTASSSKAFTMGTDGMGSFSITNGATVLTLSGSIDGSGNLQKSGGTLILTGANTYSGNTTISSGTLQVGAGSDAGALGSGAVLTNNGALLFNVGSGNRTLAANMSGTGSLTKNGTGALTLSGSNSYNGATTVNGGSLIISGSTSSSAITINSGATLGGSGSVGTLVINSGATLSPGNSPGTLTVGNTTWEGGGNYNWQIYDASGVAGTGWDLVNSAGTLAINSTSGNKFNINLWSLSGITPDVNGSPTGFVASNNYSWTLASFASVTGFDAGNFAITTSATNGTGGFSGFTGTFSLSLSGGNITLDYAAPNNSAIWTAGSGNWSTGANWQSGNTPSNASPIDFSGSGGTSTNNNQLTSVTGLTFTANATGSYTVNGSALEIGAIGVANDSNYAQTVSANLTMMASQTFSAAGANLTVSGGVNNGGYALTFSGNNSGTLSGVVSGNGSLAKSGTGTLTVSGSNTYSGGTTITAGTVQIRNAAALGSSGTISFGGGTLQWGNVTTDLSARFSTAGGQDFNIDTGANTVTFNTSLANSGGSLTKDGSGTLQFAGANTLSSIILNSGTLRGGNSANTFGGSNSIITLNGGELRFSSNFNTYGNNIVVQSNSSIHNIAATGGVVANIVFGNLTLSESTLTVTSNNASLAGNILFNGTTTLSGNATFNVGTSGNNSLTLRDISETGGARSLTKTGVGTLTINGSAAYTGATTVSAGVLKIGAGGSTGSLASSTIVNDGEILVDRTGSITLAANMSGTGALTKNSSGTLTLTGNSSYSGGTTLNSGTLVIGHANAAGSGTITQSSGSSLLTIATTGTLSNAMSVYNVGATQSATLSGPITVSNATFDVETGDTLTISGNVSGSGGVTKNGAGALILSGSNSYASATTVNAGTLQAASANALGANSTVTVNGGSFLVTADDALESHDITLNSTATGNGTAASLVFSGTYNGTVGALTLSRDSILDLGTGSVVAFFSDLVMGVYNLQIYNWTGTTLWGGGSGNNTDQIFVNRTLTNSELNRISLYSSLDNNSFLGTAYQFTSGPFANEIIPVPEPSAYIAGLILLVGTTVHLLRRRLAMGKNTLSFK
jgi:autotransporter-associated beta strand protein